MAQPPAQFNQTTLSCPDGKRVMGTGFSIIGAHTLNDGMRATVEWIRPSDDTDTESATCQSQGD